MNRFRLFPFLGAWLVAAAPCLVCAAGGQAEAVPSETDAEQAAAKQKLFEKFRAELSGAALVGHFTIIGRPFRPAEERYEIASVEKVNAGDYWVFQARIKYGEKDVTLPLPLEVKWAGDTPVITLTRLTIPGLGTFSARVVIHEGKYAGTWSHGEVNGHLFGAIERAKEENEADEAKPQEDAPAAQTDAAADDAGGE